MPDKIIDDHFKASAQFFALPPEQKYLKVGDCAVLGLHDRVLPLESPLQISDFFAAFTLLAMPSHPVAGTLSACHL